MTEQRQQAVRNLEPNSLQGQHARIDMRIAKLAIYELAEQEGILAIVASDADLVRFAIVRELVLAKPAPPAAGAAAAVSKAYDIAFKLWVKQDDALRLVKKTLVLACDHMAKQIIEEPDFGVIRRSILQIITLLSAEYSTMTHQETLARKEKWRELCYGAETDLGVFTVGFRDEASFINMHVPNCITDPEQMIVYQHAIDHVPALATLAKAAFYQAYPLLVNQTMENCVAIYRNVYRTQYVNSTAAQFHASNQVKKKSDGGTSASTARENGVSNAQMEAIIKAVTQAMTTSAPANTPRPKGAPKADRNKREGNTKPLQASETLLTNGMCHRHQWLEKPHSWEHCFTNPDRVEQKK